MRLTTITPEFVELVPAQLEPGVLYISERYKTVLHKCCCGCGQDVVTPLSSAQWQLQRAGNSVTLYPSVGNWSFPCQSHYWIRRNKIVWAAAMTPAQIARARQLDQWDISEYIHAINASKSHTTDRASTWKRVRVWFGF